MHFIEDLIRPITGPVGIRLRRSYYGRRFKRCGAHLTIEAGVFIEGAHSIIIGNWVWIDKNVVIIAGVQNRAGDIKLVANPNCRASLGEVIIGDRCHIALGAVIQGHGGVFIGDACTIGSGSMIYSLSNSVRSLRTGPVVGAGSALNRVVSPVAIGNNVWLGLQSIVIGNTIHENCFVKPMSLVVSDIPANSIASGNPAQRIGLRYMDLASSDGLDQTATL